MIWLFHLTTPFFFYKINRNVFARTVGNELRPPEANWHVPTTLCHLAPFDWATLVGFGLACQLARADKTSTSLLILPIGIVWRRLKSLISFINWRKYSNLSLRITIFFLVSPSKIFLSNIPFVNLPSFELFSSPDSSTVITFL